MSNENKAPITREQLIKIIKEKRSFLCIGLDSDIKKIPEHLLREEDPVFAFNKEIIDATYDLAAAYKPNLAFYESGGWKGIRSLDRTVEYINRRYPDQYIIADAKRGDIGNTSTEYAKAYFKTIPCDAITVAPYMGEDSVTPFLAYPNKWVVLLILTSNKGSDDFQMFEDVGRTKLYEEVLMTASKWGNINNLMFVVGATKATMLADIRKIVPNHFLLVPGVGAQGGSLQEVAKYGMTTDCGLLVNSSRNIIFASNGKDFANKARIEALKVQQEMETLLIAGGVV